MNHTHRKSPTPLFVRTAELKTSEGDLGTLVTNSEAVKRVMALKEKLSDVIEGEGAGVLTANAAILMCVMSHPAFDETDLGNPIGADLVEAQKQVSAAARHLAGGILFLLTLPEEGEANV